MKFYHIESSVKNSDLRLALNLRVKLFTLAIIGPDETVTTAHPSSDTLDGEQVAVKVFVDNSTYIERARIREMKLLKTLNHKNVMHLIACEKVIETGQEVLILEYCQGGSVKSLLEHPANSLGFEEDEFLNFLRDITEGLRYLKSLKIIHRDIKPGNIMRKIESDGR
ncbi:inhibitor of nuclear factor kappa-B kinase subunit epsilon-like [Mya arenaria]|uniref:inhibitor of nuclear factor kappa-B kinase subunit epsilon-like n=1 Tax=Mya arenaria TaxID=6604 RepID=UPI0022DFFCE4|nr:inhibitor of nuclear factor kappa-B kinase subunit epsilon-like [Mya arenaria]